MTHACPPLVEQQDKIFFERSLGTSFGFNEFPVTMFDEIQGDFTIHFRKMFKEFFRDRYLVRIRRMFKVLCVLFLVHKY